MHDTVAASAARASSPATPRAVSAKPPTRISESRRVRRMSSTATTVAPSPKTALRVGDDESERPRPGVVRGRGELLLLAVEEAVRGGLVRHQLVVHPGVLQRLLERRVVLGRDVCVR